MRDNILLIEDDLGLADPLKDFFEDNGLNVRLAETGEQGLALYHERVPDLIVLDVKLPGMNGFEVISEIKKCNPEMPVIMMTGTEFQEKNQIKGFQFGAISYMEKPILPYALLALIKNLLVLPSDIKQFNFGECKIRIHSQAVEINGSQYVVREKDVLLLRLLLDRPNQIVSRSMLLRRIWHDDHPDKNNLLDTAISRIKKLLKPCPEVRIRSIYGEGYLFKAR